MPHKQCLLEGERKYNVRFRVLVKGSALFWEPWEGKVEGVFEYMVLIASEVNVELLISIEVDFFVQIACPRLSIDWSYGVPKPLLTPF